MKRTIFTGLILVMIINVQCVKSGNSSDNTAPADPAGTISYNLQFFPQEAVIDNCNCVLTYPVNGPHVPNGVFTGAVAITINNSSNLSMNAVSGVGSCSGSYLIASVGTVAGLGAVTTHPASGYTYTVSATKGSGYVVQVTDYDGTSFTLTRVRYYRFYITDYILSTSGGVLGVYIKYQGPF